MGRPADRTRIENVALILDDGIQEGASVLIEGDRIRAVTRARAESRGAERGGAQVVDGAGGYLAPGYIDLHIHGILDRLVDRGPEHLAGMCRLLPRFGVTGFLPTVTPLPAGRDTQFLRALAGVRSEGSLILGFFLEGPFLSLTGALPREAIGRPTRERVSALIEAARPYRAIFAAAPDLEGALELIPLMAREGTPVFITHTAATARQTLQAIEAGASHATHFYDVFPAPRETDPGVRPCGAVEAILASPQVTVDFILDGEHVDPVAVRMALACKGPGGVCLITDANLGAGLPPGTYAGLGGTEVSFAYEGAPARMTAGSPTPGALAGSGLTLDRAVRNAVRMLGLPVHQAVAMASANPARVLGLADRKGRIREGGDADLVLLTRDLQVRRTWVGGVCRFEGEAP